MIKRKAKRTTARQFTRRKPKSSGQHGYGYEMPPDQALVQIYFDQKASAGEAAKFYAHYEDAYWQSPNGTPYRNWKVLASDWLFNHQQALKLQQRKRNNQIF